MMTPNNNVINVCVSGATGWTGSEVTRAVLIDHKLCLVAAVARKKAGGDVGTALGENPANVKIVATLAEALERSPDVLIDYTHPDIVKQHILEALNRGVRVVVGTSGLTAEEYKEIDQMARSRGLGVIASGNFSLTAALAKHFALIAARYIPSREIIDYAYAGKPDAPSGTTRELAEELAKVAPVQLEVPIDHTYGLKEARGGTVAGTQMHSLRLPGYVLSFEALFGLPDERLTIRHDAGTGAAPYVAGTLLAVHRVMGITGLVRGLDTLLFSQQES